MESIIKKSREWLEEEIKKQGSPHLTLVDISYQKGIELAGKLGANVEIVKIASLLIDIKLGETKKKGVREEHTKVGAEAAKIFLENLGVANEISRKIINCIEAHHGGVPYICLEAEICANADCYRFIHPKGVFIYLEYLGHKEENTEENLKQLEYKLDEKYSVLSLDICKKELEGYYQIFKKLITDAKNLK